MTTENQQMLAALGLLHDDIHGKLTEFDGRVAAKEGEVDTFVANARNEFGHVCVTPNQAMLPNATNDGVDQLNQSGLDLTIVEHAQIVTGSASAQPTSNGTDFLNNIQQTYSNKHFKVLDITWAATGSGRFHDQRPTGPLTHAAYIKPMDLTAGTIGGAFSQKIALNNGWGLWGSWDAGSLLNDHGPLILGGSGRMLIALYGSVTGRAPLENNKWALFPYLAG